MTDPLMFDLLGDDLHIIWPPDPRPADWSAEAFIANAKVVMLRNVGVTFARNAERLGSMDADQTRAWGTRIQMAASGLFAPSEIGNVGVGVTPDEAMAELHNRARIAEQHHQQMDDL